jgi:hypothetical protein
MWSYSFHLGSIRGSIRSPVGVEGEGRRVALPAQRAVHGDRTPQAAVDQPAAGPLRLPTAEVGQPVVVVAAEGGLAVSDEQHDRHRASLPPTLRSRGR